MALEALCAAFDGSDEEDEGMDECVSDNELSLLADLLAKDEEEELPPPRPRDSDEEHVSSKEPQNRDEEESMVALKAKMARMEKELAELKSQVKTKGQSSSSEVTSTVQSSGERKRSSAAAGSSNGGPSRKRRSLVKKEDEEGVVMRRRGGANTRVAHTTDDENCLTDHFSHIKIRNPLVSSATMKQRMGGRKMIHLPRLASHVKDGDIEGDWVTIGVIVKKLPPRDTKKGEKYSIWHLSNLSNLSTVSLFLFGNVYKEHWKIPLGNVVALLNANIMTDRESNYSVGVSGTNQYSLKLDHPAKLMLMGLSQDYTLCKSYTKSGNQCQNFASKSNGGVCDYHVQNAYKKATRKRSELQASNITPSLTDKLRKMTSGGGMGSSGSVRGGGASYVPKSAKVNSEVNRLLGEVKEARSDGDLRFRSGVTMQCGSDMFKKLLQQQSVGARLINTCLKKEEIKKEGASREPKSAAQLLMEHSQSTSTKQTPQDEANLAVLPQGVAKSAPVLKKKDKQKKPVLSKDDFGFELFTPDLITTPHTSSESAPRSSISPPVQKQSSSSATPASTAVSSRPLSTSASSSTTSSSRPPQPNSFPLSSIADDDRPRRGIRSASSLPLSHQNSETIKRPRKADIAKLKALSVIREKGLLDQQQDPNSITPKELSTAQRIKVQAALDSEEKASPGCARGGRFSLGSKELQAILDARSSHEWIVEEDERKLEDRYFTGLEKKEAVEERLRNLKELKVKVVQCKECAYTAESPGELCRREHHTLTRMRAIKRCFECQGCQQRIYTYGEHYPSQPCRCGEYHFVQTSLSRVRKGPKLPSEELLVRGHEEKFLK